MARKFLASVLTMLLLAALGFAQSETPTAKGSAAKGKSKAAAGEYAPQTAVAKPDKALMQAICDAWSTLDVANSAKFYAKDGPFPFYDIAPMKYANWQEYETGAKSLLANFQSAKLTVNDDAIIRSQGNGALGTATVHMESTDKDGKATPLDLRWTVVWEKRGANWLVVHEQISTPLQMK